MVEPHGRCLGRVELLVGSNHLDPTPPLFWWGDCSSEVKTPRNRHSATYLGFAPTAEGWGIRSQTSACLFQVEGVCPGLGTDGVQIWDVATGVALPQKTNSSGMGVP